jgi:cyclopropane-fatty-acyl-phospholipid synthase
MANKHDLDWSYTQIDRLFRASVGQTADFSNAKYDGDFSLTLEQAQRRKHEFIAEQIGLGPGTRVLDMTCGWGPFLHFAQERGAHGIGTTLARAQVEACRRHGLDVHLMDCRTITPDTFGRLDAVVSSGGFEHFATREDYDAGRQDAVYDAFFRGLHALLPPRGRFYMQSMVFGRNMVPADRVDINAPRGSDGHVLALLAAQFPGSWLPYGLEQIERTAAPYFRTVHAESGRLDYIETTRQWKLRFSAFGLKKLAIKLTLLPRYLTSKQFRDAFASGIEANSVCFQRELLDHYRIVLERP